MANLHPGQSGVWHPMLIDSYVILSPDGGIHVVVHDVVELVDSLFIYYHLMTTPYYIIYLIVSCFSEERRKCLERRSSRASPPLLMQ
jgi:hypothetical protein